MDQLDRLVIACLAVEKAVSLGRESGDVIPEFATQCSVPPSLLAWAYGATEHQARIRAQDAYNNAMRGSHARG